MIHFNLVETKQDKKENYRGKNLVASSTRKKCLISSKTLSGTCDHDANSWPEGKIIHSSTWLMCSINCKPCTISSLKEINDKSNKKGTRSSFAAFPHQEKCFLRLMNGSHTGPWGCQWQGRQMSSERDELGLKIICWPREALNAARTTRIMEQQLL